jgi:cytoskeletal protein RodZ
MTENDFAARRMSASGFGERLKRERELRGVSRDEVCTATRITARYLEALESEQWEILPGGVFNRGFVRGVARFLGLDEDDLLTQYDAAMNEQKSQTSLSTPIVIQIPRINRRRRLVPVLTACTICVLLGAAWFTWRWHDKFVRHRSVEAAAPAQRPVAAQVAASNPSVDAAAPTVSGTAPENQAPALELKIEAGKETSVTVSADGTKVFEGSMIAGQSRTFSAQAAIDISANDAGALLLELNGQTLAPLGPPGQPGNATLTRDDLKPKTGGAD